MPKFYKINHKADNFHIRDLSHLDLKNLGIWKSRKRKLEMEIGNGNGNKKHTSLVQCFLHTVLSHYSCIVLSNGYMTGFMSPVLCLYYRTVGCDYCF